MDRYRLPHGPPHTVLSSTRETTNGMHVSVKYFTPQIMYMYNYKVVFRGLL